MKFVLTGGGTAGHIYPALAVAENLQDSELHYLGGNGMEKDILKLYPKITFHQIPTVKFERKPTLRNLLIPFKLVKSVKITKNLLKKLNPDAVFSKGGFVSLPVVFAAKSLKIPIISHESDLSFGLANKIILKKCNYMCTTFEETSLKNNKCIFTGQPIRKQILNGKNLHIFSNKKPTILVLGGSLGSTFINNIIFDNVNFLTKNYNIIHICGKNNYKKINHNGYKLIPYAENIQDYYKSCDVAVCRSGSGVINELLALKIPMLLIPLSKKSSRGDQIENALNFKSKNYAEIILEEDFNINLFIEKLNTILKNKQKIAENMKNTCKKDSAKIISKLIKNCVKN